MIEAVKQKLQAEVEWILGTGRADLCIADFLHAAANLPSRTAVPVILFAHNVEHVIWRRLAASERRIAQPYQGGECQGERQGERLTTPSRLPQPRHENV